MTWVRTNDILIRNSPKLIQMDHNLFSGIKQSNSNLFTKQENLTINISIGPPMDLANCVNFLYEQEMQNAKRQNA